MFINTVDKYGDQATIDMLITRTLDEYRDNSVTRLESHVFEYCTALAIVDVPKVTYIGQGTLGRCTSLLSVVLRNVEAVCTLDSLSWVNTFRDTPIASGTGYIYVPRALVDSYKAATNWSTYAAQFRALEDYTVDGTITGDLDESKI